MVMILKQIFFPSVLNQFLARDTRLSGGVKRLFDIVLVVLALLVLSPMLVGVTLLVLAVQGRPVFIKHMRVGRYGGKFGCFKFRSMVVNGDDVLEQHLRLDAAAEKEWRRSYKLQNDPRITPLGRVLRKTSVDELPQLFNVLRGDMSLVGPRPIVQSEVVHYGTAIGHYFKVRPGLTGAWQVSGRSDVCYERRVDLDTRYVETRSFGGDIIILARTIPAVLMSRGSC